MDPKPSYSYKQATSKSSALLKSYVVSKDVIQILNDSLVANSGNRKKQLIHSADLVTKTIKQQHEIKLAKLPSQKEVQRALLKKRFTKGFAKLTDNNAWIKKRQKAIFDYIRTYWNFLPYWQKRAVLYSVSERYINKKVISKLLWLAPMIAVGASVAYRTYIQPYPQQLRTCAPNTLPGVKALLHSPASADVISCQTINWLNKIDWSQHRQTHYFPGSTFIICHPNYRLSNDRFFKIKFKSKIQNCFNTYVLFNRTNNLLYSPLFLHKNNNLITQNSELAIKSNHFSEKRFSKWQYIQNYLIQHDTIPITTNHFFQSGCQLRSTFKYNDPLFNNIYSEASPNKKKAPKRKRLRSGLLRAQVHTPPKHTLLEKLSNDLVSMSLGQDVNGVQRFVQYRTGTGLTMLKKVIRNFIYQKSMYTKDFNLYESENCTEKKLKKYHTTLASTLDKFVAPKHRRFNYRYNKLDRYSKVECDLLDALQKDVYDTDRQELNEEKLVRPTNRTTYLATQIRALPKARNPYNKQFRNQWNYFGPDYNHPYTVYPHFQQALFEHMRTELQSYNLTFRKIRTRKIFKILKPAVWTNYRKQLPKKISRNFKTTRTKQQLKIKQRIIKNTSSVFRRKFSGYLFPDANYWELKERFFCWKNNFFNHGKIADQNVGLIFHGDHLQIRWLYEYIMKQSMLYSNPNSSNHLNFSKKLRKVKRLQLLSPFKRSGPLNFSTPPLDPENSTNHWGKVGLEFGFTMKDSDTLVPRFYRHSRRGWLLWIDPPKKDLAQRRYNYTPNRIAPDKAERAKNFKDNNLDFWLLQTNQKQVPFPRKPLVNDSSSIHRNKIGPYYKPFSKMRELQTGAVEIHDIITPNYTNEYFRVNDVSNFPKAKKERIWTDLEFSYDIDAWSYFDITEARSVSGMVFIYYAIKVIKNIYNDYSDAFYECLTEFFLKLELEGLFGFKSLSLFVLPPSEVRFSSVMGADELLKELYPTMLYLRSKRERAAGFSSPALSLEVLPDLSWKCAFNQMKFNEAKKIEKLQSLNKPKNVRGFTNDMIAKGYLFIGPPGTGKTFLVKALAGETGCPVITTINEKQIDSVEQQPYDHYQTTIVTKKVFKSAATRAPSILFIDEVDTLGPKRSFVLSADTDHNFGFRWLSTIKNNDYIRRNAFHSWQQSRLLERAPDLERKSDRYWTRADHKLVDMRCRPIPYAYLFRKDIIYKRRDLDYYFKSKISTGALEAVTILLCELDGLNPDDGVIVIGATNRPQTLDSAVVRPGRLGKVLYLDLPNKQKRLELLQFHANPRYHQQIDWNFFANNGQTGGLSAAHIKVAMNASTLSLIRKSFDLKSNIEQPNLHKNSLTKTDIKTIGNDLTIDYGLNSVRFQNLYAIQRGYQLAKLVNQSAFNFEIYNLCKDSFSKFYVTTQLDSATTKIDLNAPPNLILNSVDGIFKSPALPIVSTKIKPTVKRHWIIKKQIHKKFFKKVRLYFLFTPESRLSLTSSSTSNHNQINNLSNVSAFGLTLLDQIIKNSFSNNELVWVNYKKYCNRLFSHNHLFGLRLLMDSPYFSKNPLLFSLKLIGAKIDNFLIKSPFQYASFSNLNVLHFNLLSQKNSPSIFQCVKKRNHFYKLQKRQFGDGLSVKRAAYYGAGKALIISLLDEWLFDSVHVNLWNNVKVLDERRATEQAFIQQIAAELVTRKKFENYLLALISGKAAETLLCVDKKTLDSSDLGAVELKKMGWLATIMIEKGLLYTTGFESSKYMSVPLIDTESSHPVLTAEQKRVEPMFTQPLIRFDEPMSLKNFVYWWQPKVKWRSEYLDYSFGVWIPYEKRIVNKRTPREEVKARYPFPHYVNYVLNHAETLLPTHHEPKKARETPPTVNKMLAHTYHLKGINDIFETCSATLNDLPLAKTQPYFAQLLRESFGKAFYLLENNRPFFDLLMHEFYINNRLTGLQAKRLATEFFNPKNLLDLNISSNNTLETTKTKTNNDQSLEEPLMETTLIENQTKETELKKKTLSTDQQNIASIGADVSKPTPKSVNTNSLLDSNITESDSFESSVAPNLEQTNNQIEETNKTKDNLDSEAESARDAYFDPDTYYFD